LITTDWHMRRAEYEWLRDWRQGDDRPLTRQPAELYTRISQISGRIGGGLSACELHHRPHPLDPVLAAVLSDQQLQFDRRCHLLPISHKATIWFVRVWGKGIASSAASYWSPDRRRRRDARHPRPLSSAKHEGAFEDDRATGIVQTPRSLRQGTIILDPGSKAAQFYG
jgi:hypothetical protein